MIQVPRLSEFLKKRRNLKYRRGFSKYLTSASFEEYRKIWTVYISVVAKLVLRYQNASFPSRNWFKHYYLKHILWGKLYAIFALANIQFMIRINKELGESNKNIKRILETIHKRQEVLKNIQSIQLNLTDISKENIIKIHITVIDGIYSTDTLIKSLDELQDYQKTIRNEEK